MARYIDADVMQDFLVEIHDVDDWCISQYNADWISSFIESQPTAVEKECDYFKDKADFLEVVRCKDCAYYVPLGDNYEYKGKKAMHCILRASCTGDNYYCADGKRKEKDNEG